MRLRTILPVKKSAALAVTALLFITGCETARQPHTGNTPGGVLHLPLDARHGMPLIPCKINDDRQTWMVLDTGSQPVILEADTALKRGVSTAAAASGMLVGVAGSERVVKSAIPRLQLGGRDFHHVQCVVRSGQSRLEGGAVFGSKRVALDVIGMDFLRQHFRWVTLDQRHGFAALGISTEFEPVAGAECWRVPVRFVQGLPFVQVTTRGVTWSALLDTGAAAMAEMSTQDARRLGVSALARSTGALRGGIGAGAGGPVPGFQLSDISGLGPVFSPVECLAVQDMPKIGMGLMRHFRVTFDFERSLVWLQR
jgi:predicted aspartyl protease